MSNKSLESPTGIIWQKQNPMSLNNDLPCVRFAALILAIDQVVVGGRRFEDRVQKTQMYGNLPQDAML